MNGSRHAQDEAAATVGREVSVGAGRHDQQSDIPGQRKIPQGCKIAGALTRAVDRHATSARRDGGATTVGRQTGSVRRITWPNVEPRQRVMVYLDGAGEPAPSRVPSYSGLPSMRTAGLPGTSRSPITGGAGIEHGVFARHHLHRSFNPALERGRMADERGRHVPGQHRLQRRRHARGRHEGADRCLPGIHGGNPPVGRPMRRSTRTGIF